MFKNETVFILGAGSSKPYGYPLGKELIKEIIDNIKKDAVHVLQLQNLSTKYYFNENVGKVEKGHIQGGYELDDFIGAFRKVNIEKFIEKEAMPVMGSDNQSVTIDGNNYAPAKLKQFRDFYDLMRALVDFDPVSIDAFLRDHPAYSRAGKIMIVYSLLKHENKSTFTFDHEEKDNWYSFFLNDILSGCDKPENITENKLSIITFNYDLSLDYCVHSKLSTVGFLKGSSEADKYISDLIEKNTFHVYGKLYSDLPKLVYGDYAAGSGSRNDQYANTKRFLKSVQSFESIKSIYQERQKDDKCLSLISNAKDIYVIGFGFDRDNLNILSFPESQDEYGDFLRGKNLKYMDYKGQMNSLFNQFEELKRRFKHSITRSNAEKITYAYLNDFKINLY